MRHVPALNSPAKQATHCAVMQCRRYLNALMTLNAVELLLVTNTVVHKAFIQPSATFDRRVLTYQVILLSFQQSLELVGNTSLQSLCHLQNHSVINQEQVLSLKHGYSIRCEFGF